VLIQIAYVHLPTVARITSSIRSSGLMPDAHSQPIWMIVRTSNCAMSWCAVSRVHAGVDDHNASDPGITLIELFSFLGENLLFGSTRYRSRQAGLSASAPGSLAPVAARSLITMTRKLPKGCWCRKAPKPGRQSSVRNDDRGEVYPVTSPRGANSKPGADQTKSRGIRFAVRALDAIGPLPADREPVYYHNETVRPMAWVCLSTSARGRWDAMDAVLSNKDKDEDIKKIRKNGQRGT